MPVIAADSLPLAAAHEECERLERIIVKDFDQDLKGHREKLAQGHRVRKRLDELQALSTKLVRTLIAPDSTMLLGMCSSCRSRTLCGEYEMLSLLCRREYMQMRMVQGKRRLLLSRDWMSMALGERKAYGRCMTTEQLQTA